MWFGGRWWNRALIAVAIPVALVGLVAAAWAVDRVRHDGGALRNVEVEGRLVGQIDAEGVRHEVADLADRFAITTIEVDLGDDRLAASASDLGISLDIEATTEAVLAEGRAGDLADQLIGWATNLRGRRSVEPSYSFDEEVARSAIESDPRMMDQIPVAPEVAFDGETLEVLAAIPGRTLDVEDILAGLGEAVAAGQPAGITSRWVPVPARPSTADAERLVAEVVRRTAGGVIVEAEATQRWIPPKVLHSWMGSRTERHSLELVFDEVAMHTYVEGLFSDLADGFLSPDFDVVDGLPILGEVSDERMICCGAGTVDLVSNVVVGGAFGIVQVPLRSPSVDESHAAAASLGIEELVGSFTTNHRCCESRVTNIQRIADLVRGVVLEPGESLSINDFIGRRTRQNGFVGGGVIERGRFDNAVGGGISQFATTLFNAAFFAGLDIPTYQSHSIYISRYPYGREATLSFPAPDLVIENTSDFAVLLWTAYTETSITVEVYSTQHIQVKELEQSTGRFRSCTVVTTPRQRTYPDGRTITDDFMATYRPGEGLDCNGRPTATG